MVEQRRGNQEFIRGEFAVASSRCAQRWLRGGESGSGKWKTALKCPAVMGC